MKVVADKSNNYVTLIYCGLCLFQGRLQSPDSGKHLHDVLDLLQKHTLVEADISAQAERIKAVQGAAQRFTSYEQGESFPPSTQLLLTPLR